MSKSKFLLNPKTVWIILFYIYIYIYCIELKTNNQTPPWKKILLVRIIHSLQLEISWSRTKEALFLYQPLYTTPLFHGRVSKPSPLCPSNLFGFIFMFYNYIHFIYIHFTQKMGHLYLFSSFANLFHSACKCCQGCRRCNVKFDRSWIWSSWSEE